MEALSLQKAVLNDIPVLNEISMASKMHWNYPPEWLEHWKKDLTVTEEDITRHQAWKLVAEDKIIGFCVIVQKADHYEITHLWIHPSCIGRGHGRLLLEEILTRSVKPGTEVIVISDPNAEKFYHAMGFTTFDHEESYPKGRFLPVMKKTHLH